MHLFKKKKIFRGNKLSKKTATKFSASGTYIHCLHRHNQYACSTLLERSSEMAVKVEQEEPHKGMDLEMKFTTSSQLVISL